MNLLQCSQPIYEMFNGAIHKNVIINLSLCRTIGFEEYKSQTGYTKEGSRFEKDIYHIVFAFAVEQRDEITWKYNDKDLYLHDRNIIENLLIINRIQYFD